MEKNPIVSDKETKQEEEDTSNQGKEGFAIDKEEEALEDSIDITDKGQRMK